jgi:hypothetical protein
VPIPERRTHRRVPVHFTLHCRRLDRAGFDEYVEALDLSPGGAQIHYTGELDDGDLIVTTFLSIGGDDVGLRGRVVGASSPDHVAHIAFVDVSERSRAQLAAVLSLYDTT